jgi:hypothetical protein
MKLWIITALLFSAAAQSAQSVDTAFERLAKVGIFAFGGIGYAGVTSSGEKDYRAILARPSAMADFEKLYLSSSPQAKCYALVGIRKLNPQRFEELTESLRGSKEKVTTMHGCIVSSEPLGAVIKQIESGEYSR